MLSLITNSMEGYIGGLVLLLVFFYLYAIAKGLWNTIRNLFKGA